MKKISIITPEIKTILSRPDKKERLKELFSEVHPYDIFLLIEALESQEVAEVVIALGLPKGIEVFEEFKIRRQREIFHHFSREWMADVLEEMHPDDRVDFMKALPRERREELLPLVAQAQRNDIKKLLQYKEDTAGSLLTTEYASLSCAITVKQALDQLKLQAFDRETIYYVYIVDVERRLLGFVSLKDLLVARSDCSLRTIMHANVVSVNVDEDKEVVAKKLSNYDFLAIPVVDHDNKLLGIVTVDDVVDVIIEENTEDIYRYGAAGEYIDYMSSSPLCIAKQRILWLLVLVVMGFVSAAVMKKFQVQLETAIALVFFIPLLSGSSGNAGTQSSTVIIRGLATGEVKMKDLFQVWRKEAIIGLIVGLAMGACAALRALIMDKSPLLGITVGLAMVVAVVTATMLGGLLPLLFKKLKLDPALMSGPFITSIVDVVTIFIYLQMAMVVLGA